MARQPVTRSRPRPAASLSVYRAKRDFRRTPEPAPAAVKPHREPIFVVQEHHATRLHYDFRLEADGVLKSWAVTNEPSPDPAVKRLAVRVEDHPVAYARFSGTIPKGEYGAGEVSIWDRGTYRNLDPDPIADGLAAGKLSIELSGRKLKGRYSLVRMRGLGKRENWLLIKGRDEFAVPTSAADHAPVRRSAAATPTADGKPRREIVVTNPDKVIYPDAGFTKSDVAVYYRTVAPRLLPFLKDRPVTLERLPDGLGAGKPHFWQKNTPDSYPAWIPRVELVTERGKPVKYVLVNDRPTLLFLVNQGALTFHPWLSRLGDLDRPDFVLFDLDPGPAPFSAVIVVAKAVRQELADAGRGAVVKTSGKTGLHVLVPWAGRGGFDAARDWALGVATRVAEVSRETATVEIRKAKRGGRVYIDVLQNARGHHAVPPYVLRPVPEATVSTPLRWTELTAGLDPRKFTLRTVPTRLTRLRGDPLAGLLSGS